jgi:hypothetical protein
VAKRACLVLPREVVYASGRLCHEAKGDHTMQPWVMLDDDEFPDDKDIEAFGDDAPPDDDPLTIGYVRNHPQPFFTPRRIYLLVGALLVLGTMLLLYLARVAR